MIYQDGEISVDASFARFGSKTYAINKINSTDVRTREIAGSRLFYLWWLIAAIFAVSAFNYLGTAMSAEDQKTATTCAIVAAFCGFLGWLSFRQRASTYSHELYLTTSSQDQQAYVTSDAAEVAKLKAAIEQAIAAS